MNREFDREIDALLRRHTRAAARGRVLGDEGASHSPQSGHLDADELSAFAENALPAAARSLYVAHLADCTECRRAVAGLAGTSNVSAESERKAAVHLEASESSARGGWLSALFAPRVLRYAFPALALCLVGVIAFVALRSTSPQEGGQLARRSEPEADGERVGVTREAATEPLPAVGVPDEATPNANASVVAGGAATGQPSQPAQPAEQRPGGEGQLKDTTATGPAPDTPAPLTAAPPPPAAADAREAVGLVAEVAPKPVSKEKGEEAKLADAAARERQSNNAFTYDPSQAAARGGQPRRVDIEQMPDGSRNTQRSEPQQNTVGRANNTLPMLSRPQTENDRAATAPARRGRTAAPRDRREDEEASAGAETHSVSGHRFRRQGGVWVDVKYSASLPTTGVRRGTEGYRALVADIPELGRIAEQLAGEIVVVVKGRAYRIR